MIETSTLLIIEDQPESLRWLHQLFVSAGYRVLLADSGELALSVVQDCHPDLILLDVIMPGMDGYEVCRRLKEIDGVKHIPVVFLSALEDANDRIRGFRVGGVDFIHKPFLEEEVLLRVKTQCDLRRLQQSLEQLVQTRTEALEQEVIAHAVAQAQVEAALDENKVLMRELQHRAKNSFSMILGMIDLASIEADTPRTMAMMTSLGNRIRSVSDLYSLLYSRGSIVDVPLHEYLSHIAGALVRLDGRRTLLERLSPVKVNATIAAPLGLMVTELVTNSLKYAFPDRDDGTVFLNLDTDHEGATLVVADDGIGLPPSCYSGENQGTGLNLVRALCRQVNAELELTKGQSCRCTVHFRL